MIKNTAIALTAIIALGACTPAHAPTAQVDDRPLYGGCKEWRPAYGPKPADCR